MRTIPPATIALLSAIAAAAALGVALAAEHWGRLAPCELCLVERWPYRVAVAAGLIGSVSPPRIARLLLWLLLAAVVCAAAAAAVHVGVEAHWWPSPFPECAAPHLGGGSIAERLAAMPSRPGKPCDDPTFLIPGLPMSMAAMNLAFALVFAALLTMCLVRRRGRA